MKILLCIFPFLFALACASENELQTKFDSIIANADEVEVSAMVLLKNEAIGNWHQLVILKTKDEISAVRGFFRLEVPRAKKVIVDGKDGIQYETTRALCPGDYRVIVKKGGNNLIIFTIHHGAAIRCDSLFSLGDISIDQNRLAPFHTHLKYLPEQKWANQRLQTTTRSFQ